jgi:hypothetical protein
MLDTPVTDEARPLAPAEQRTPTRIPLYDAAGEWVGTLREPNPHSDYVVMEKGGLFPHTLYIPRAAVGRADPGAWYLAVRRDQMVRQGWEHPPARTAHTVAQ